MLRHITIVVAACLLCLSGRAGVDVQPDGVLKLGKSSLSGRHYDKQWKSVVQPANAVGMSREGGSIRAPWRLYDGTLAEFGEVVRRIDENTFRIDYTFRAEQPAATANLSAELKMPVDDVINTPIIVDGKEVPLHAKLGDAVIFTKDAVQKIEFALPDGRVFVELPTPRKLEILDCRTWNQNIYNLRISFSRPYGDLRESDCSLTLRLVPYRTSPVNLAAAANRNFADEVESDSKGGWTDQGELNDLRVLTQDKVTFGPLTFPILNPAMNGNRACLVVAGKNRLGYPQSVTVKMNGEKAGTLALLHALAWQPAVKQAAGRIIATFQDGSQSEIPVISGVDAYDWWNPSNLENGAVAWHGRNASSNVGLFCSIFPLPERSLKSLTFEAVGDNPVWMVVSALLVNQPVTFPRSEKVKIARDKEWRPFATDRSVEKGSALDFSFLLDPPAGKYGHIRINRDGHYQFEKQDKPIRFYGANLVYWALYMEKNECDMIAERLARIGYNAIRIHHFDRDVVDRRNPTDSSRIIPEQLDKLDYLIYVLEKNGIYITTDVFTDRMPAPDEFPDLPKMHGGYDYKAMAMISAEVRNKLKKWAREIFTHRNPYTGMSWAEDPALIGVSLLNENSIFFIINGRVSTDVRRYYEREFEQYCRKQEIALTPETREAQFNRFCLDVYNNYYADMSAFLRELGVTAPLTDQNFIQSPNYNSQRMKYDYVDNHIYWDHPRPLGGRLTPVQFCNFSVLQDNLLSPRLIMPSRIYGKPFTVTEYDFCYPNRFRAEGAPVFSAYAAMQGWDGVYRFSYSGGKRRALDEVSIEPFDVANDVIRVLSERIAAAFFVRGDVAEASQAFAVSVPEDVTPRIWPDYPYDAQMLGLYGRVGSVECSPAGTCTPNLPKNTRAIFALTAAAIPANAKTPVFVGFRDLTPKVLAAKLMKDSDYKVIRSSTGELTVDFNRKTFVAATPYSEAMVLPRGEQRTGDRLTAKSRDTFSVVAAVTVDNQPLASSRRILLLHLTDVQLEGITFKAADQRVVTDWPSGQLLARKGTAEISLNLPGDSWKLYALNPNGKRIAEIPWSKKDGRLFFVADTFGVKNEAVFAYELTKEER